MKKLKQQLVQDQTPLTTFLDTLKSKPIEKYSLLELQDKIDTVVELYKKENKSNKELLSKIYSKIAIYYNEQAGKKIYKKFIYE